MSRPISKPVETEFVFYGASENNAITTLNGPTISTYVYPPVIMPPVTVEQMHQSTTTEATSEDVPTKRTHICSYCSKQFNRPSALKTHYYTHTSEKPYLCKSPGCGRSFSVVSNLKRHQKVHERLEIENPRRLSAIERVRFVRELMRKTAAIKAVNEYNISKRMSNSATVGSGKINYEFIMEGPPAYNEAKKGDALDKAAAFPSREQQQSTDGAIKGNNQNNNRGRNTLLYNEKIRPTSTVTDGRYHYENNIINDMQYMNLNEYNFATHSKKVCDSNNGNSVMLFEDVQLDNLPYPLSRVATKNNNIYFTHEQLSEDLKYVNNIEHHRHWSSFQHYHYYTPERFYMLNTTASSIATANCPVNDMFNFIDYTSTGLEGNI